VSLAGRPSLNELLASLAVISIAAVLNHTQVEQLAYNKYLQEVMSVLMDDKEFANKVLEAGTALSEKVITLSVRSLYAT